MNTIIARNVNDALPAGIMILNDHGVPVSPRGMLTLEIPGPVGTTYMNPYECVLFEPLRDANPFFHLFEALWILAGRNDVAFLTKFNSNMAQFSANGSIFHAPYGARMRKANVSDDDDEYDQVNIAIEMLKKAPDTRQVVIQIWDWNRDLGVVSPDIPCNLLVLPKIRHGKLNITVMCRSNDIIWGAYGANAVQFSILQQYMACCLGVEVGTYTQISDSYHVYIANAQGSRQKEMWDTLTNHYKSTEYSSCPYTKGQVSSFKLLAPMHKHAFDNQVTRFCNWVLDAPPPGGKFAENAPEFTEPFITCVAMPMFKLWWLHQEFKATKEPSVLKFLDDYNTMATLNVDPTRVDWLQAGMQWVNRREMKNV